MKLTTSQQQNQINPLIRGIMDGNNEKALKLLNHLIFLSTVHRSVYVSQGTLAAMFDTTREWVNKLLRRWKDLGVIKYRQRDYNRSCIYFFHPLLNQEKNRISFKLPAAALLFSVSSLYSAVFHGPFTLNNIRKYIYENSYQIVPVSRPDYGFYEQRPVREQQYSVVFLKNKQTTTTIYPSQPLKERVMNQSPVINLIADAYGLSRQQEDMLSNYSDAALEYAVRQLAVAKDKQIINSPVGWIAKVAAAFREKGQHSLNGKVVGHSAKPRNPNGHSLASHANFNRDERIAFLVSEIASFTEKIANPQKYFHPNVDMEIALTVGRALLKANEDELAMLQRGGTSHVPVYSNKFMDNYDDASAYSEGADYIDHLDQISHDKSDSEGYKLMVRRYDYKRTARSLRSTACV